MDEEIFLPARLRPPRSALAVGIGIVVASSTLIVILAVLALASWRDGALGVTFYLLTPGLVMGGIGLYAVLPDLVLEFRMMSGRVPVLSLAHTASGVTISVPRARADRCTTFFTHGEPVRIRMMKSGLWDSSHAGAQWWITSDDAAVTFRTITRPDAAMASEVLGALARAGLAPEWREPLHRRAMS
jgi:hypothetical protein